MVGVGEVEHEEVGVGSRVSRSHAQKEAGRREIMEESGLRPLLPLFPDTVAESVTATFFACRA
jgi:hypothetical protein